MLVSLIAVSFLASPVGPVYPAAAPVVSASARAMSDADILGFVDQVNRAEIEEGKLALTKTSSAAVRSFANMLVTDHTKAMASGNALARKLNITITVNPDTSLAHSHDAEMVKLNGLTGKAFDQEFAKDMADGHKAVIKKVNTGLIPDATSPALKTYLRGLLPTLQKHERGALALEKNKM